jgi:hypothetical protein
MSQILAKSKRVYNEKYFTIFSFEIYQKYNQFRTVFGALVGIESYELFKNYTISRVLMKLYFMCIILFNPLENLISWSINSF